MDYKEYWRNILSQKETEEIAYQLAKEVHEQFKGEDYGSPSYFYSLAERLVEENENTLGNKLKEESERQVVKKYWHATTKQGKIFLEVIQSELIQKIEHPKYKKRYSYLVFCFWCFLANLIALEEEKNDSDIRQNDL